MDGAPGTATQLDTDPSATSGGMMRASTRTVSPTRRGGVALPVIFLLATIDGERTRVSRASVSLSDGQGCEHRLTFRHEVGRVPCRCRRV
ncbi:MAG: hypothetical protein RMH81_04185 [Thermomicrobium sp.]|nr:hypothetical protein [Thermomicrobium sp.]